MGVLRCNCSNVFLTGSWRSFGLFAKTSFLLLTVLLLHDGQFSAVHQHVSAQHGALCALSACENLRS